MFGPEPFGFGFNFMFTVIPVLVLIGFVLVFSLAAASAVRYFRNARSPRESVYARVVAKRTEVTGGSRAHGEVHRHSRTHYYITLEFDNGARKEYLDVKQLSGLVVEGDAGYASVQGDWILAFERQIA